MKWFLLFITALLSLNLSAQANNESMATLDEPVESSVSLELELDGQVSRDEKNEVNGLSTTTKLSSTYTTAQMHAINLNTEISFETIKSENDQSHWEYVELGYSVDFESKRLNTQLTSSLYYQYTVNSVTKANDFQKGVAYLLFESETTLMSKFSIEGELQASRYITTSSENGVVKSDIFFEVNPVFAITDSIAFKAPFSSTFYFVKGEGADGYQGTSIAPTLSYLFKENLEVEAYAELTPFQSHDGNLIAPKFEKDITYGVTLTYGMF